MLSSTQIKAHYEGIGSSVVPAILGLESYVSEFEVWKQIVDPESRPDLSRVVPVRLGNAFEAAICDLAAQHWNIRTEEPNPLYTYRHPKETWALCHPDRLVWPLTGPSKASIEAKLRGWRMRHLYAESAGAPLDSELAQVHWQMLVTGFERVYLAVIIGNEEERHWCIERSEADCEYLLNTVGEWWHRHVVQGNAPPAHTREDVRLKWPRTIPGKRVEVDAETARAVDWYRAYTVNSHDIEEERNRMYTLIAEAAGDAEELYYEGRRIATHRQVTRSGIDGEKLRRECPTIAEAYATTTTYRKLVTQSGREKKANRRNS